MNPLSLLTRRNDPLVRFYMLWKLGGIVAPGYRFRWPQLDWWQDEDFNVYLRRFSELGGMNTGRRWMLAQLIRLVSAVPGDTAECGVFEGAGSYWICRANATHTRFPRTHYAFDSYEGLSAPGTEDGGHWTAGDLAAGLDLVKTNLAEFSNVELMKGWIPDRFSEVAERRFAFVHIDVDLEQPTLDSIEFFYPRMNHGGIVLFDDYGSTICPGATKAIDAYLANKPEKAIALSEGGGFLIKGCETASVAAT